LITHGDFPSRIYGKKWTLSSILPFMCRRTIAGDMSCVIVVIYLKLRCVNLVPSYIISPWERNSWQHGGWCLCAAPAVQRAIVTGHVPRANKSRLTY
jgi:hypothetical protein